jgi:hypothetical protein
MQVSSLTLSAIPIQEAPPPVISHQPTVVLDPKVQEVAEKVSLVSVNPIAREAENHRSEEYTEKIKLEMRSATEEVGSVAKAVSLKLVDKPPEQISKSKLKQEIEKELSLENENEVKEANNKVFMAQVKTALWVAAAVLTMIIGLAIIANPIIGGAVAFIGIQFLAVAHGHFESAFYYEDITIDLLNYPILRRQASLDEKYQSFLKEHVDSSKYYVEGSEDYLNDLEKNERLYRRMLNDPALYKCYRDATSNMKMPEDKHKAKDYLESRFEHVYNLKPRQKYIDEVKTKVEIENQKKLQKRNEAEELAKVDGGEALKKFARRENLKEQLKDMDYPKEFVEQYCKDHDYECPIYAEEDDLIKDEGDIKIMKYKDIDKMKKPIIIGFRENNGENGIWDMYKDLKERFTFSW